MADVVKTVSLDQFEKTFFQHLNELRLGNLFCDVRFNVNGTIMPCHRLVLLTVSPYFKTMFNGNFKESSMDTITMNDIETEIFEEILNAMYTASIRFSPSNAFFILKASHFLQLEIIENACESYIKENPKINYLIDTCVFVHNIERLDLYYVCLDTIEKEVFEYGKTDSFNRIPFDILQEIIKDKKFSDIEEESVLLLIMKWSKENKASRVDMKRLLRLTNLKITEYVNSSLMAELLSNYDDKRIENGNKETSQESSHINSDLPLKLYLNAIDVKTGQQGWTLLKMNDEMNKYAVTSFYATNSCYKKVCKIGSKFYCFEYSEYQKVENVFSCYDEDDNRCFLPSPEDTISEFEMFVLGTSIYVMSKKHRFSVWLYDIERNKWRNIVKKNIHETIYCNVSACTFSNGVFYIIADEYKPASQNDITYNKYVYSIINRHFLGVTTVTRIGAIPRSLCKNLFINVFDGKILVSGTWLDSGIHDTLIISNNEAYRRGMYFNFIEKDHKHFNLFHFNGFMYVLENGRAMVLNGKYDLRLREWTDLPLLPKQLILASTNVTVATGDVFSAEINL